MRIRVLHIALLAAFLAFAGISRADELRTFDLKYRTAEELMPLLRPLLDDNTRMSGSGNTLLIRGPKPALEDASKAIGKLDSAPRQLLITVRQGDSRSADEKGFGIGGPTGTRVYSTEQLRDNTTVQRVRTLEGRWAHIRTGQKVPVPHQAATVTPQGTVVQQSIEYKEFATGFEVRARLAPNDRVILSLRPFREQPAADNGGRYDTQRVISTVEGPLGQWLEIGGQDENRQQDSTGITYRTEDRYNIENRIRLKVQRIK